MKALIIVPTYNEKENIVAILTEILKINPDVHCLVVDDNSPDGTASLVKAMSDYNKKIFLLERAGKEGLGRAYIAGFKWGLARDYSHFVEMDADFSHRPSDLKRILAAGAGANVVVGSRYVAGGKVVNWGWTRKLISRGGSLYSRIILGFPINDWTGGFNMWTRTAIDAIGLDSIKSNGYAFQIEMKFRACRAGLDVIEVPITFEDRRIGHSKMSGKIVIEAFYRVWGIRWS